MNNDHDYYLGRVKRREILLQDVPYKFTGSKDIVLEAIKSNPYQIKDASDSIKDDEEVMIKVVEQAGLAIKYASERLRSDRDFMLKAVSKIGSAIAGAIGDLKNDKELILVALMKHEDNWQYLSKEMQACLKDKPNKLEAFKIMINQEHLESVLLKKENLVIPKKKHKI